MSHRPIMDAGPGLNFLSINKPRLLIGVLGPLSVPETVEQEILRKADQDARFSATSKVWKKLLPKGWVQVLPDTVTPELSVAVQRITQRPMHERVKHPKDLGEAMVIAHAVVAAQAGHHVTVLIDDGQGARTATAEAHRLDQIRSRDSSVGSISLVSTLTVLERAAGTEHIPGRADMRTIYGQLYELDDGLVPIENTRLLSPDLWG